MAIPQSRSESVAQRARSVLSIVVLSAAMVLFGWVVNQHYPLRHWMFFVYIRFWAYLIMFVAAALATGWRLLRITCPDIPMTEERLALAFALGVLAFVWGVFVAGILGLLHPVFFFAWPCLMLLGAGRRTYATWHRALHRLRPFGFRLFAPRSLIEGAAAVFLVLACVAIYLQVINPLHLGADTHWYHLPIAERYAVTGRIRAFPEGWYLGAYPQLASLLYTWAFLAPGDLFDHAQLASHVEWTLLLATLFGISSLARRVFSDRRVPYACAALFLFPGIFLYDSSLVTGADHVLAFWAAPVALAVFRLRDNFRIREGILVGLMVTGAILTKYQGSYFFVAATVALLILSIRTRRLAPTIAAGLTCLLASSCHWFKNIVFYGDPFYPLLNRLFPAHPFHPGALALFQREYFHPSFTPSGSWPHRLLEATKVLVTFSFVPHDFAFHGMRPVFGSLFTLTLPLLLFVRPPRRLWWLVVGTHIGIMTWFLTSHEDRFLQALVPWMATATAAVLMLAWRMLNIGRTLVALLVLLQVVDGGDVYFLRVHGMIGDSPLRWVVEYLSAGNGGRTSDRFRIWGGLQDIGKTLPRGSGVLMHHYIEELGLGVPVIADGAGWQGAIDYLSLDSPANTVAMWRKLGATHLVWHAARAPMSPEMWAREAVFVRAMYAFGSGISVIGGYETTALVKASRRQNAAESSRIAWVGCGGDPPTGIYSPTGLAEGKPTTAIQEPSLIANPQDALAAAHVVLFRSGCRGREAVARTLGDRFLKTIDAGDVALYARR